MGIAASSLAKELTGTAVARSRKPNIILILSDDVGLGNLSCYGGDNFKTPRLDELAASGIRFEQCYLTPLCGPSRSQIMTGRYPFRTGVINNRVGKVLQPTNETTIPKVLKPAGYVTAHVGKWSQLPLEPGDWGFDECLHFAGSGVYWAEQNPTYTLNGKEVQIPEDKYVPDLMHEFLVDFMTRRKDRPFFVYYCMSHIHAPILRTPDSAAGGKDYYSDNVAYMDKLVGKLISELERLKLRDSALVIFVGDNGTAPDYADRATVNGKRLSGHKGTLLEGGSRVPMIVSWPGTTSAGRVNQDLVDFSDFLPTYAEIGGAKLPQGVTIDGHSFAPQIRGQNGSPREWVYVELNGKWYVRNQRYKLNSTGKLFDLKEAPFVEKLVPANTAEPEAIAARKSLQTVLDKLNPAAGKQSSLPARERSSQGRNRKRKVA